jgi:adenine-specific DNA methylase
VRTPLQKYHYEQWRDFFNPRQLLSLALINQAIWKSGNYNQEIREIVLAGYPCLGSAGSLNVLAVHLAFG